MSIYMDSSLGYVYFFLQRSKLKLSFVYNQTDVTAITYSNIFNGYRRYPTIVAHKQGFASHFIKLHIEFICIFSLHFVISMSSETAAKKTKMANSLEQLKALTVIVADTGEFEGNFSLISSICIS